MLTTPMAQYRAHSQPRGSKSGKLKKQIALTPVPNGPFLRLTGGGDSDNFSTPLIIDPRGYNSARDSNRIAC